MKSRYYPHVTVAFAALLTFVPLALIYLISAKTGLVGSSQSELQMAEFEDPAVLDTPQTALVSNTASDMKGFVQSQMQLPDGTGEGSSINGFAHSLASGDRRSAEPASTGFSEASAEVNGAVAIPADSGMRSSYAETTSRLNDDRATQLALAGDRVAAVVSDSASSSFSPGRVNDMSISNFSDAELMADLSLPDAKTDSGSKMEDRSASEMADRPNSSSGDFVDQAVSEEVSSPAIEMIPGAMARDVDALLQSTSGDAGSYYDATGHLALMNQVPVGTTFPTDTDQRRASEDKDRAAAGSATGKSHQATEKTTSKRRSRSKSVSGPNSEDEDPATIDESSQVNGLVEDVILQTPLENRPVGRIENVLAVTRAKGWPVALVRSDLPGDDWWVQQMVGIQGNAFTARVNFGNADSIAGSAYRLVFVFLDSPDEVRRFRIAKQFKELPEGVRRSREYLFIRQ